MATVQPEALPHFLTAFGAWHPGDASSIPGLIHGALAQCAWFHLSWGTLPPHCAATYPSSLGPVNASSSWAANITVPAQASPGLSCYRG